MTYGTVGICLFFDWKLKGFKVDDPPRTLCPKIQGYASTKLKWDNAKYKTFPTLLQRFKGMKLRVKVNPCTRRIAPGRNVMMKSDKIMKDKGHFIQRQKNRIVEALVYSLWSLMDVSHGCLRKEEKEKELKLLKCVDMEKTTQNTNISILDEINPGIYIPRIPNLQQRLTYFGHIMRANGLENMLMLGKMKEKGSEEDLKLADYKGSRKLPEGH
ncbi:hypothetical protein LAZ67_2001541 [Cordylochernes scorpioides]|uniref:Uncharacterized protein n=1 Tax=Cordylochernes scorpioides TaxID=51811 RepID=A0ABY6K1B6_9ARAC|nr:hypothetical protein LAZ67_2001541 [Cordylochernes scorpioides]